MSQLSDELLLEAYDIAKDLSLSSEFLTLLEFEINLRGLYKALKTEKVFTI
ncbi:sporulation histidine kinase inhibitor Sda [Evansella sp. AB-rgal1]|uniref:sporulation histidine kinase inhibitor Sda n=1 Tax=Evansella sp. AB-rgal1 TaxID=3242696 RepID=UPI00359E8A78